MEIAAIGPNPNIVKLVKTGGKPIPMVLLLCGCCRRQSADTAPVGIW